MLEVAVDANGSERPGDWAKTAPSTLLLLALDENHGTEVVLETADAELKIVVAGNAPQGYGADAVDASR